MKTPSPTYASSTFTTPLGEFSVAVDSKGNLVAAVFGGLAAVRSRLPKAILVEDPSLTGKAEGQLSAWFRRRRRSFTLPLAPVGSPFQRRVWSALGSIPYGATLTYGELAKRLHTSARAVGRANATNPVCVVVPCHRVIGGDGSLTGYAFGEATKRALLDLEAPEVRQS